MNDSLQKFMNIVPYAMGIGTLVFGIILVTVPLLIGPRHRGSKRALTYESGEPVIGQAWIQFHSYYYIYALVFMGFDVETAFIVPCVTVLRAMQGWQPVIEIVVFLIVLSLSLVYALRKRVLEWK